MGAIRRFWRLGYAAAAAGLLAIGAPAFAQTGKAPVPVWLTCPDEAVLDLKPDPDRDPARIKAIQPKVGKAYSPEIYTHARFADAAYDLYAASESGQEPRAAFAADGLTLIGLVYGDPGPAGERPRRPVRGKTLFGFVADDSSGRRYVVFRGTQEPAEWVRNIQVGQRAYPDGGRAKRASAKVHAGFWAVFESLEFQAAVQGAAAPMVLADALPGLLAGKEPVFVGHSLGGALATLAGVETARRAPDQAPRFRVVTLASPRVGDPGFANYAAKVGRIDRVCNLVDIVTAVPPSTKRVRYVHVGKAHLVSSFDYEILAQEVEKPGDQVLCWHGHHSYGAMLSPDHGERDPAKCFSK